jgi:hypothetical protein
VIGLARATVLVTALVIPRAAGASRPAVAVGGDSRCPIPSAVAAHLGGLLLPEPQEPPASARRARVDPLDGAIRVRLEDDAGRLIAERALASGGTCEALAEAAAVMIASWATSLRPGEVPTLELGASAPAPPPSLFDVGLGAQLSHAAGEAAPGASLQLFWGRAGGGLALLAGARGSVRRTATVDTHAARWQRWTGDIGVGYLRPAGGWQLGVGAGLQAGWLSAAGSNFPMNLEGTRFSPGAFVLGRLARPLGPAAVWLAAGSAVSLFEHRLVVLGSTAARPMRIHDLHVTLGVSVGRFQ